MCCRLAVLQTAVKQKSLQRDFRRASLPGEVTRMAPKKPPQENKVTSVRLSPELRKRFRKYLADQPEGTKKQEVFAAALDEYLKKRGA